MTEIILNDGNFKSEVLESKVPVLVDFWAEWCGPCQMMGPVIADIAAAFSGRAKVGKLNVDENPESSALYGVTAIPTLVIFKDGKAVDKVVGLQPKQVIEAKLTAQL
ncbi:MAG: thioredoxin [Elusimicrobia bacterium HGW-Elusimicrobia-1]|nr:MAG: thioredoxin [Elusimicrobia bacterium HGW-Elusimicrobia-1]